MSTKEAAAWSHTNAQAVARIHKELQATRTRKQRARLTKAERVASIKAHAQARGMTGVVQYLETAQRPDGSLTFASPPLRAVPIEVDTKACDIKDITRYM
jgi:hypothetical protein